MKKTLITVGTFDGVHSGHRFLFTELEKLAVRHRLRPLVLYFPLPPKTVLAPHPEMSILTTPDEKKALFKQLSLTAHALDFGACRNLSAQEFAEQILSNKFHAGGILAGPDFAFGRDRQGDTDFLRAYAAQNGMAFYAVPFYKMAQDKISSSFIRKTLVSGDIALANALLGRPYEISGRVVKGNRLGRKLGFPTANLDTGRYKLLPLGVFAVRVRVGRRLYNGFCNIGFRPTVNTLDLPLVEVHIFDFKQSIYGRKITVWFHAKLRAETKFSSLEELTAQLRRDRQNAYQLLGRLNLNG